MRKYRFSAAFRLCFEPAFPIFFLIGMLLSAIMGNALTDLLKEYIGSSRLALWGIFLISAGLFSVLVVFAYRFMKRRQREKHIPIIVIIGRTDDECRMMVNTVFEVMEDEYGFNEKQFEDDFDIRREDLIVRRESDLPLELEDYEKIVHRFDDKITRLAARFGGQKIFHIFLNTPSSYALPYGLGAILGCKYEVILYHFQPGPSPYIPVVNLCTTTENRDGVRVIRTPSGKPFECIEVEEPNVLPNKLYVSLRLSNYDPKEATNKLARNTSSEVVHISNTYGGNLDFDADWLKVAREAVTVLRGLNKEGVFQIHFCPYTPLVVGFAIGMGLGTRLPFTVYELDTSSQEYKTVLNLNSLRR